MDDETIRLQLDLGDSSAKAKALDQDLHGVGKAAEGAAKAGDKLEKSSGNSAMAMLQLGRGIQDFQAAGLAGIVNNFEGLALALGLGGGVAGVATIAAVGIQVLLPQLKKLADSFKSKEAIEEAKAIEQLAEAGEKLKEKLQALAGAHTARASAMEAENQKLERQIGLEEQASKNKARAWEEETKRQVAAKAGEAGPTLDEKARMGPEKARAAEIEKIMGGPEKAAMNRLFGDAAAAASPAVRKLREELEGHQRELASVQPGDWKATEKRRAAEGEISRTQRALAAEEKRARDAALGEAGKLYGGDAGALRQAIGLLPEDSALRGKLQQLTPEAENAQKMKDVTRTVQRFIDAAKDKVQTEGKKRADKAAQDKREKDDRLVDQLHAEGGRGELEWRQAMAKDRARAEAESKGMDAKLRGRTKANIERQKAAQEERFGQRAQQYIYQQTGAVVDPKQAAQIIRQQQQQLAQAQAQGVGMMLSTMQGQQQQIANWHQAMQQMRMIQSQMMEATRQRQQALGNIGWY